MHVADFSRGNVGANGIVGGGIGLATDAALTCQLQGRADVSIYFFGDGAANQGALAEAMNLAALWSLPLVLVCENNGLSEFSPTVTVTSGQIVDRAKPYGAAAVTCDGNDVVDVMQTAAGAIARARDGRGPTQIEARTYRLRGHVESEATFLSRGYRSDDDVAAWRARDPFDRLRERICDRGRGASGGGPCGRRRGGRRGGHRARPCPRPSGSTGPSASARCGRWRFRSSSWSPPWAASWAASPRRAKPPASAPSGRWSPAAIYGELSWGAIKDSCLTTLRLSCMVIWIVFAASIFTALYAAVGAQDMVREMLTWLPGGRWGVLLGMQVIWLVMGAFLDPIGIMLITMPLFFPLAVQLGFDPIWFNVLFVVNMEMAFLTPPFGFNLFYLKATAPPTSPCSTSTNRSARSWCCS